MSLEWVVEQITQKHGVSQEEVEEVFRNPPYKVLQAEEGKYRLYGRTEDGRYLFIVFVWEERYIITITARDMTAIERRLYGRK